MRLAPLFDVSWHYDLIRSVGPSAHRDEQLSGQGEATFTGRLDRRGAVVELPPAVRWLRLPGRTQCRRGGRWQVCTFSVTGMSSLTNRSGVHVMTFQTEDIAHGRLTNVIAIGEGSIDPDWAVPAMRYYACVMDYLPSIETPADQ